MHEKYFVYPILAVDSALMRIGNRNIRLSTTFSYVEEKDETAVLTACGLWILLFCAAGWFAASC